MSEAIKLFQYNKYRNCQKIAVAEQGSSQWGRLALSS